MKRIRRASFNLHTFLFILFTASSVGCVWRLLVNESDTTKPYFIGLIVLNSLLSIYILIWELKERRKYREYIAEEYSRQWLEDTPEPSGEDLRSLYGFNWPVRWP